MAAHTPVQGKGYFVLPGDRLQAGLSELIKSKPGDVLRGPKGCEYLCYLLLGPLNEKGMNWEGWRAFGVSELLIKCIDQGKRVFLAVVSGTEAVEGGQGQLHQLRADSVLPVPWEGPLHEGSCSPHQLLLTLTWDCQT